MRFSCLRSLRYHTFNSKRPDERGRCLINNFKDCARDYILTSFKYATTSRPRKGARQHRSPVQKYTQNFRNKLTYTYPDTYISKNTDVQRLYTHTRTLTLPLGHLRGTLPKKLATLPGEEGRLEPVMEN